MKRCLNCMELIDENLTVCPRCGYDEETTEERFDQLKPGSLLKERFTVGRPLGRGGFGITYIAWDNSLQRKVAIKEYLPRGMALRDQGNTTVTYDVETKEAFLRGVDKTIEESRKLAGFSDLESVVNVYDCFKENGTAYIVMEVLRGENVKEKISREGPVSFEEMLRIMTPVLKTLGAVHKSGLIHRDISPDNIFICDSGKIKLLDFGSARIADNSDERSRSIVLKHGYAPKEQYTSKGKQGPYTDIYAVCATIYKMLTGITPVDSLERIADEDELQDISELVKIPSTAAKAIMKGLSVNASDRIQSAGELLEKLNEKEDKKASAYYDAEETVTLYVPKPTPAVISDEPVTAGEIAAVGGLNKSMPESREKPVSETPGKKPNIIKIAVIAVACIAAVAAGIGAASALKGKRDKTADKPVPETAATVAQTIDNVITESLTVLTSVATEKSTTEKTTAETTTESSAETTTKEMTLDESKLTTGYIKTNNKDNTTSVFNAEDVTNKKYKDEGISGETVPASIKRGSSFGVRGKIYYEQIITNVTAGIYTDANGNNAEQKISVNPNSNEYDLSGEVNHSLIFGKLSIGTYYYRVTAVAAGKTNVLINKQFNVVSSFTLSGITKPTSVKQGDSFGIRGTVTNVRKMTNLTAGIFTDANGIIAKQRISVNPNSNEYDLSGEVNHSLIFGRLSKGTYYYRITASDDYGTEVLINQKFTVE